MKIGDLEFKMIMENKELVPPCIYNFVSTWNEEFKNSFSLQKLTQNMRMEKNYVINIK